MESSLSLPELARLPTRVPGLDAVLGGGLLVGDAYLVAGSPGTGKTTLGNQLAFAHAAAGGTAVVATLGTETHDRMLAHLRGFRFADPALVGGRLRYVSLLDAWQGGGIDGAIGALMGIIRQHGVGLVVVDGTWGAGSGSSATAEAEVGATGSARGVRLALTPRHPAVHDTTEETAMPAGHGTGGSPQHDRRREGTVTPPEHNLRRGGGTTSAREAKLEDPPLPLR